jgi:hypothetical protein
MTGFTFPAIWLAPATIKLVRDVPSNDGPADRLAGGPF